MNYAIISLNNNQYQLQVGDQLSLEGQIGEIGKEIVLGQLLLLKQDQKIEIGQPQLKSQPLFSVISQKLSPKVKVATYKAKSRYRKTKGHRQLETTLKLISFDHQKPATTEPAPNKKVTASKPPTKKTTTKTKAPKKA